MEKFIKKSLSNSFPLGLQTSGTFFYKTPPPLLLLPAGKNTACLCSVVIWFIIGLAILYSLDIFTNMGGVYITKIH